MRKCTSIRSPFLFVLTTVVGASFVCMCCAPRVLRKQDLPVRTGFVTDSANLFDSPSKDRLESVLMELKQQAGIEFAVLTVRTTAGIPIASYALGVVKTWRMDDVARSAGGGLLFVVPIEDDEWYMAVSPNLQNDLPSDVGRELWESSKELWKQKRYAEAIDRYVDRTIDRLEKIRGFSMSASRAVDVTLANSIITRPSYKLRVPANRGWVLLPAEDAGLPGGVFMRREQGSVVSEVKVSLNPILDAAKRAWTATQVADDYRDLEHRIMVEQGVNAGLYQLREVRRNTEDLAGKHFFKLEYVAYTPQMENHSALYVLFRLPANNVAFLLVLQVQAVPTGATPDAPARDDFREILESLSFRE